MVRDTPNAAAIASNAANASGIAPARKDPSAVAIRSPAIPLFTRPATGSTTRSAQPGSAAS